MTPEINRLKAEIDALEQKRAALIQAHLSGKAIAQVGEIIFWGKRKGRVISFETWCGEVAYKVRSILKDGSDGAVAIVYPYNKPTALPGA